MTDYSVHKDAYDAVNNSIFILGPGRTGSTLSGRIVQSLKRIEYVYEPLFLYSLIPLVTELSREHFQLLFETYLYEEKFLDLVAGRGWNFNEKDESSILRVKSEAEIKARIGVSLGKLAAMEKARGGVLAFKLTDVAPFIKSIKEIYPQMRFILTHREAYGCIASLVKKEWFSDATLKSREIVWNGVFVDGMLHPHWLPNPQKKRWSGMTALERAALYYREMYSSLQGAGDLYIFSYDTLMRDPHVAISDLASWIHVETTSNTERIINSLYDNSTIDKSVLNELSADDRAETLLYSDPVFIATLLRS